MSDSYEPTCNLRLLQRSATSVRLQQWWQKTEVADDFMIRAIMAAKIPEPEGEWRDVSIVEGPA